MDTDLHAENAALRRQLDELIAEARCNEEKLRRFDRLERSLIGSQSLAETVDLVLNVYRSDFELDAVTLALVDGGNELTGMLASDEHGASLATGLLRLETAARLAALHRGMTDPVLEAFDPARHAFLFDGMRAEVASVALLPLVVRGQSIGSLNLGSRDPRRFGPGRGTELLGRLAALVAVCLDSAVILERVKRMGLTDALTGLGNRRYFERRCEEEILAARRHALPLACMFLDIDRFKRINDTLGHPAGDEVLRRVADLVRSEMRGNDVLARFGGEEFVALLPQTSLHQAMDIAERVRKAICARPLATAFDPALPVSVSIGIAGLPPRAPGEGNAALAGALIGAADRALYQAKQAGRNRVLCEVSVPRSGSSRAGVWHELLRRVVHSAGKVRGAQRRC